MNSDVVLLLIGLAYGGLFDFLAVATGHAFRFDDLNLLELCHLLVVTLLHFGQLHAMIVAKPFQLLCLLLNEHD